VTQDEHPVIVTDDIDVAYRKLAPSGPLALDLETTGLRPYDDKACVIALSDGNVTVIVGNQARFPQSRENQGGLIDPDWLSNHRVVTQNGTMFDLRFWGIPVPTDHYDVRHAEVIIQHRKGVHQPLASLRRILPRYIPTAEKLDMAEHSWNQWPLTSHQIAYVSSDVKYLPKVMELQEEWYRSASYGGRAIRFEQATTPMLAAIMRRGMPFDDDAADLVAIELEAELSVLNNQISEWAPGLNVTSPQQVKRVLHSLGLSVSSTARSELIKFTSAHPIIPIILRAKRIKKHASMLSGKWRTKHVHDGRVYPTYNPTGTGTFRFSAADPNIQQCARDTRGAFAPTDGNVMAMLDYHQQEIRVAALESKDSQLADDLMNIDIHTSLAEQAVGPQSWADMDPRRQKRIRGLLKGITFTWLFGGGQNSAIQALASTGEKPDARLAANMLAGLQTRYRTLSNWQKLIGRKYSRTFQKGRKINLRMGYVRALRPYGQQATAAINSPIQHGGAMILKQAVQDLGVDAPIVGLVHDEIVFETQKDGAEHRAQVWQRTMEEAAMKIYSVDEEELPPDLNDREPLDRLDFPVEYVIRPSWDKAERERG